MITAGHPGITESVDGGRPLSELAPLSSRQVAGLGAAVATTLADLHDLGIVHGAVAADHILIDPDGLPRLWPPGHDDGRGPAGDVAALAEILQGALTPAGTSRAVRRALAGAAGPDPRRRPSARRLAQTLADRAEDPRHERLPFHLRTGPATVASAVAVAGLVPLALLGRVVLTPSSGPRPPAVTANGSGRYLVGDATDRVALGRWQCHDRLAALLRPSTGEVWVWDSWAPPGRGLTARRVAQVAGAKSLRVHTPVAGTGCDRLMVTRSGGQPVEVDPSRRGA